ncbi:hypothetical protein ACQ4N7_17325 [Nodosilinea sp. AN01ver1]|uniref:hypothetical protein n=1 Tax=Nodosilinea sp. AN01ver1 TaxID=3423362 RepID=UPI003D3192AB
MAQSTCWHNLEPGSSERARDRLWVRDRSARIKFPTFSRVYKDLGFLPISWRRSAAIALSRAQSAQQ